VSLIGWVQIAVFLLLVALIAKPLGVYVYRSLEGPQPLSRVLGPVERMLFKLSGIDSTREQTWQAYTLSMIGFSVIGGLITYLILRLQHGLPLNPQGLPGVGPELSFNTSISFVTNTNWQSYSGESTMSDLSQMAGLAWHNFTSAATGVACAVAIARGLTRKVGPDGPKTIGNFWADVIRITLYVLLPIALVAALIFCSQGAIQSLAPYKTVTTLEGAKQILAMGPVASQEAIKMFGTNGGGFFNANSAHPFENPTPLMNFLQMLLIFSLGGALTYTYGRMARSQKQGWALFAAMAVLFVAGVTTTYAAESNHNPAIDGLGVDQHAGNLEGKETRFGVASSALFATVTTDASCGAVNSMHDSFTPIGGLVPMVNIQLGEVIFGGVGSGLYGMLIFALLSVFIAGLMVGRTPEYLGKKIETKEMKLAMLYVLIFPLVILAFSAWASVKGSALTSLANQGPHGLSEILYAFSSGAGNNGSAFAGLNANTPFWNVTLALAMFAGRFLMLVPALGIAGSMVNKKTVAPGPGTFPTDGALFSVLLIGVIILVGALTFFPALCLGPVLEHFSAVHGQVF
jgi:K+-transporting ATPase ATPase A chain